MNFFNDNFSDTENTHIRANIKKRKKLCDYRWALDLETQIR